MSIPCPACGFIGATEGPAHAYMSPSPACWARYGEILAREYSDPGYWQAHRLLTDAYCGAHSLGADRRARQSLWIHLSALMLHFVDAVAEPAIVAFLRRAAKSGHAFPALDAPEAARRVSYDRVYAAQSATAHQDAVEDYARAVLASWALHHGAFRSLIEEVGA